MTDVPPGWQRTLPHEEGDWLWVALWGCGCACVRKSGIAWVVANETQFKHPHEAYQHRLDDGTTMSICWTDGRVPDFYGDEMEALWWMKLDLPRNPPDEGQP